MLPRKFAPCHLILAHAQKWRLTIASNTWQCVPSHSRLLHSSISSLYSFHSSQPNTVQKRITTVQRRLSTIKAKQESIDAFKIEKDTWAERYAPAWSVPYIQLARLNRPAGMPNYTIYCIYLTHPL